VIVVSSLSHRRLFPHLPNQFHRLPDNFTFSSAQQLDMFAWCVRLSQLVVIFERTLNHCISYRFCERVIFQRLWLV